MSTTVQEFEEWQSNLIKEASVVRCEECREPAEESSEYPGEFFCGICRIGWWQET